MPLNDDPDALSDEEYERRHRARAEQAGDAGLHTIPADELAAAVRRVQGED